MIDPSLIPGLLAAADICDDFASVNRLITHDEVELILQSPDWARRMEAHDVPHIHANKANAAGEIADFLRRMAGQGGEE